jgi:hypothetical protein
MSIQFFSVTWATPSFIPLFSARTCLKSSLRARESSAKEQELNASKLGNIGPIR